MKSYNIKQCLKRLPSLTNNKFEVGKTYIDYNNIHEPKYVIYKRTAKQLFCLRTVRVHKNMYEIQQFEKRKIQTDDDGNEYCYLKKYTNDYSPYRLHISMRIIN